MDEKYRIQLVIAGKSEFEKIIKDYSPMLYAQIRSIVLNHEDTNDILQNTFLKAWKALPGFKGNSEITTWLYRIATNEALQHIRNERFQRFFSLESLRKVWQHKQETTNSGDEEIKLENALKILSPQQRIVFGMRYLNETSFKEIAEILNLAEGTVKATYFKAQKKVEKQLIEQAE
jgi:RNA polymerase sigma-70 factor (ECF subfamily)